MIPIRVRKFNGLVLYGYTFGTFKVYWSMNFYGKPTEKSEKLINYINDYRFTETHIGIVI